MTLACAFVAAGMLTGCGSSVDENKTPEEIRQEIADWDAAKIQKVIDEYSKAIAEKTSELAAKTDELKEIPLTEMLGDKAILVVAGAPACMEKLQAKGINNFISVKSNVLETLQGYLKQMGI